MDNWIEQHKAKMNPEDIEKVMDRLGERTIPFGKHKGATYQHLFSNEKSYVAFLLTNLDKTKNNAMFSYFNYRIEQEQEEKETV